MHIANDKIDYELRRQMQQDDVRFIYPCPARTPCRLRGMFEAVDVLEEKDESEWWLDSA